MADSDTLRRWLEGLGLEVHVLSGATAEELWAAAPHVDGAVLVVRRTGPDRWEAVHEWNIASREFGERVPALAAIGEEVASGYALVDVDTPVVGDGALVRFASPVFDDGLTRQAFALTVSSLLKAAARFDVVCHARAGDVVAPDLDRPRYDEDGQRDPAVAVAAPAAAAVQAAAPAGVATPTMPQRVVAPETVPAVPPVPPAPVMTATPEPVGATEAWAATHEVKRRSHAWETPDPNGAVITTVPRHTPVQVVERRGEWAHIVCSNGWSAWIDGRDLRPR